MRWTKKAIVTNLQEVALYTSLVFLFFLVIFPVSLWKTISRSQKITKKRGKGSGWYQTFHNTTDTIGDEVICSAGHDSDPFLSSHAMFKNMGRTKGRRWIFILYLVLNKLSPWAEEKEEDSLSTEHYVMF